MDVWSVTADPFQGSSDTIRHDSSCFSYLTDVTSGDGGFDLGVEKFVCYQFCFSEDLLSGLSQGFMIVLKSVYLSLELSVFVNLFVLFFSGLVSRFSVSTRGWTDSASASPSNAPQNHLVVGG